MIPQSGTSGVQVENFIGVFAPPLVPRDIVLMLNTAISSAISSPRITENLIEMGFVPKVGKSDEFLVAINKSIAAVPDVCKIKSQCEKDKECPRPCPAEKNP
jgi:tripartite-type tricarboxylate transporter receptor subunit TctC